MFKSDSTPATKRPTPADCSPAEPKVDNVWTRAAIGVYNYHPLHEFNIDVMETEDPSEHRLVLKMIEIALERNVANYYKFEKLLRVRAGFTLGGGLLCFITFEAISIADGTIAKFQTEAVRCDSEVIEINTWKKLDLGIFLHLFTSSCFYFFKFILLVCVLELRKIDHWDIRFVMMSWWWGKRGSKNLIRLPVIIVWDIRCKYGDETLCVAMVGGF